MKLYFKDGQWILSCNAVNYPLYKGESLEKALSVYDCIPYLF